jgi:hypothetical protein
MRPNDPGNPLIMGWRVGIPGYTDNVDEVYSLPILFGSKADCERAATWLNQHLPASPVDDLEERFIKQFGSIANLKEEMVPDICAW